MSTWNFSDRGRAYWVTAGKTKIKIHASGSIVDPQWEVDVPLSGVSQVAYTKERGGEFEFRVGDARHTLTVKELEAKATHLESPFERENGGLWERVTDKPLGGGRMVGYRRIPSEGGNGES